MESPVAAAVNRDGKNRRAKSAATPVAGPLSIGALSRATQVPVETLRTWERRYGSPVAVRKPSGHRVYPAAIVDQLRRVALLLSQGHRAGEILGLSIQELDALLSLLEPRGAGARPDPGAGPGEGGTGEHSIRSMLRAAGALDREALVRELRANWVRLGPLRFLQECAAPFLVEVGSAWHEKRCEIRHEHFASACVCGFLREVREPFDHDAAGSRVVAATLPGEAHEGGLLMACLLMAVRGHRVVYLGTDTPTGEIAAAARDSSIGQVAVSISAAMPRALARRAVTQLRERLPRRVHLWVGGAGAPPAAKGVETFSTLSALDALLATQL